ncbi:MAG: DUF2891 domain-containing protein [Chitinophagales bacterium]
MQLNLEMATRFAALALKGVQQEYPNKLGQVLGSAADLKTPKELHPAFYGCFDWHSAVHSHWMLVTLLQRFPDLPQAAKIRQILHQHLNSQNIEKEVAYFHTPHNQTFERTYGWAWLLKLSETLLKWEDVDARIWRKNLQPLTDLMAEKYFDFLPKLLYPIRTGQHPNTAFGLSFAWDYAVSAQNGELKELVEAKAKTFFLKDKNAPANWEPNGFDFFSPSLQEAALMSRILQPIDFELWIEGFLPDLTKGKSDNLFNPAKVVDRSDGKLVHLDGLNLSRAWCFGEVSKALPIDEQGNLKAAIEEHLLTAIPHVTSGDYAGEHWLASFAVYALKKYFGNGGFNR